MAALDPDLQRLCSGDAELGLAAEVVVAALDPDLQRLCSGEDIPVESSILFSS